MPRPFDERGASLVLVASALFLLLGMAAIATDLGAGFNERNQDQIAADNAVMAGSLAKAQFESEEEIVLGVLELAGANLPSFSGNLNDSDWIEAWRSCVDSENDGWIQLDEPPAWGTIVTATPSTGTLDCISQTSSLLRVRIPDQLTGTNFGRVLGVESLQTNAAAIARVGLGSHTSPIVPYGLSGTAGAGEYCFGTPGGGIAYPPCSGPSSGTFGTILSEFFGDFYGTVDCSNPGADEIATATALGIDHFVDRWKNPTGSETAGTPHPGDNYVLNTLPDTNRDACHNVGGIAVPEDDLPLNTLLVDTGFPGNAMERGLVSNEMFHGEKSRLQQWDRADPDNPYREIVAKRTGSNEDIWNLDNRGPWSYLLSTPPASLVACDRDSYGGLTTDLRLGLFANCLADYVLSGTTDDIFDESIDQSPRFVWAPQYWYSLPTTGLSWEPLLTYRMAFIAGTWYNCNASTSTCSIVFYPDEDVSGSLCDPAGGSNCHQLSLQQFSAWVLPDDAVPDVVRNAFPGGDTPFAPSLWQ